MMRLGRSEFNLGRQVTTEEIEQRVDAVQPDDVWNLARELFRADSLGLCVLGPLDESNVRWLPSTAVA